MRPSRLGPRQPLLRLFPRRPPRLPPVLRRLQAGSRTERRAGTKNRKSRDDRKRDPSLPLLHAVAPHEPVHALEGDFQLRHFDRIGAAHVPLAPGAKPAARNYGHAFFAQ